MARRFLTDEAKQAFTNAIETCEGCSSAEVVVTIRARSASYLHADLIWGALAAFATLPVLLFADWEFPLWSFLVDPLLVGAIVGVAAARVPAARRLFTPARIRAAWVRRAARATFFEKGVRQTRARTGILVYLSLTERRAEVIADSGVVNAVDPEDWARAVARIDAAVASGAGGLAIARTVAELSKVLEPALERSADDVNELPDEVSAS